MTRKAIMILIAIGALVAAIIIIPPLVSKWMSAADSARISKGQGEPAIDAGAEATNTVGAIAEKDSETDKAVAGGIDEIRNASEAGRGDATLRASCRMRSYYNSERCTALRKADSAIASSGDSGR